MPLKYTLESSELSHKSDFVQRIQFTVSIKKRFH